jgi:hypothetical protein
MLLGFKSLCQIPTLCPAATVSATWVKSNPHGEWHADKVGGFSEFEQIDSKILTLDEIGLPLEKPSRERERSRRPL